MSGVVVAALVVVGAYLLLFIPAFVVDTGHLRFKAYVELT